MRLIVLDTNALVQSLPSRSQYLPFPQLNVLTLDEFNEMLKQQ